MNNLGRLRDTIPFGSDFNPLYKQQVILTKTLQTIEENCRNTKKKMQNYHRNREYEINLRASTQFTKSKQFELS